MIRRNRLWVIWAMVVLIASLTYYKEEFSLILSVKKQAKNIQTGNKFDICTYMHTLHLKGNGICKLAWKQKMFSDFHLQASFGGSVNIYKKRSAPFFLFFCCCYFEFELEAQPCWFPITKGEQKKVGSWCSWYFCHTFQPCLCQRCRLLGIIGNIHDHVFKAVKRQFLTSRTRILF